MTKATPTRDEIRAGFFSAKITSKSFILASGFSVEIRQPKIGHQLDLAKEEDTDIRMLRLFVDHVFVPGTDTKVFEDADYEALKQHPAAGDFQGIMKILTEMMDLGTVTKAAGKSSEPILGSS